jgi:DNA-binding transcriptional MerR regulator
MQSTRLATRLDSKVEALRGKEALGAGGATVAPTALIDCKPPAGKTQFSITELADAFGVTARAIRFYEDQGLISPERRGQTRLYSKRDFARLGWILRGKRTGFSLADIAEMIDLYDLGDGRVKQRQVTLERCLGRLEALKAQRRDLDAMIEELDAFCRTLENLVLPSKTSNKTTE